MDTESGAVATAVSRIEIVVRGRNVVVPDHYRQHVAEKLAKVERYDQKIVRADVELQHEPNPRQHGSCQHVEITCRTRGPVIRSEACADDFYKALDIAAERLERRLSQAADRRRVHHGRRTPRSVAEETASLVELLAPPVMNGAHGAEPDEPDFGPGQVVREKEHPAKPMSVDDALFEMELVGHDFYLFSDAATGQPSVVYRRHAYDYGLIRLTDG
ncbi:ribosome-associated translation inhibitor RaiA [Jatrophihabitans sp.]|uniref:ribosome hibernation-promoting factor, HPF/YfiA family n=1 Tax=Jatrophihabitans sp. TaxID=1932789 RepID=UPI0030C72F34|nr:sigma 54 modulation protein/ribosomal protein [Jatrophihabitans sp.]